MFKDGQEYDKQLSSLVSAAVRCLSVYLSVCLSFCLFVCLSVCLSVFLYFRVPPTQNWISPPLRNPRGLKGVSLTYNRGCVPYGIATSSTCEHMAYGSSLIIGFCPGELDLNGLQHTQVWPMISWTSSPWCSRRRSSYWACAITAFFACAAPARKSERIQLSHSSVTTVVTSTNTVDSTNDTNALLMPI